MPLYSNTSPPSALWPGDSQQVWTNADVIAAGARSQRVAIGRRNPESLTPFTVDVEFNQAPGAYELDVTVCNSDDEATEYCVVANGAMTTTDSSAGNPQAHFVANTEIARLVSVVWKTPPANGGTTAEVTISR